MKNDNLILLHKNDNVAISKYNILKNTKIHNEISLINDIPMGHKVAIKDINNGKEIIKYNQIIGFANGHIKKGQHVHTHNIYIKKFGRDYAYCKDAKPTNYISKENLSYFDGYTRKNGKVGTRNYIGIVSSVNCSSTVSKYIADNFDKKYLENFKNVDGVLAITHGTGCGMASKGLGWDFLQNTLNGYVNHPNFAGILVVGLGCEANQVSSMSEKFDWNPNPLFKMMTVQEEGGTRKTVEKGISIINGMLPHANMFKRKKVPASNITLALECGGSDAYSGISSNPSLGAAADLLIENGGTAILAETPEIYGAEHLLTRRAINKEVGEKIVNHIKWWEEYTEKNGAELNNNPSPGNKAGGLTTILEKSLGAVAKGGTTSLIDVYQYAEYVNTKGFNFMNTPGYDVASVTGMVAGGANIICFTTGRGSVFGCKPTPSIKLASNTKMYNHMKEDMDINCGKVIDGKLDIQDMGKEIFNEIISIASGKKSKSEALGFGDIEFVPWQLGAML